MSAVPVISDPGIAPALNPATFEGQRPEHTFATYIVERNDTPVGIAERFGIMPETLLGGNPQLSEEASLLQVDMELIILPVDGLLHDVRPGDSLESLAEQYGVPVEDIIAYEPNRLEFPYRLYPETQILVPGAVRELFVWEPPTVASRSSSSGSSSGGYSIQPAVVGTGTFLWPVSGRRITQYYWYGHRAIDVGVAEGTGLYASDTGTVVWADWSVHCYGYLIVIDHGNGYLTFYAHLSAINVVPGQVVYQGDYIGATGNTGCSSGPHLHFEIRLNGVHQDPFWPGYLP
jgi:murein DD-endopeptidase MepM/ murein hydrolase activator NlpD